jgi:hypothetical protein
LKQQELLLQAWSNKNLVASLKQQELLLQAWSNKNMTKKSNKNVNLEQQKLLL